MERANYEKTFQLQDWKNLCGTLGMHLIILTAGIIICPPLAYLGFEKFVIWSRVIVLLLGFLVYLLYYLLVNEKCKEFRRVTDVRRTTNGLKALAIIASMLLIVGRMYYIASWLENGINMEVIFSIMAVTLYFILYFTRWFAPHLVI